MLTYLSRHFDRIQNTKGQQPLVFLYLHAFLKFMLKGLPYFANRRAAATHMITAIFTATSAQPTFSCRITEASSSPKKAGEAGAAQPLQFPLGKTSIPEHKADQHAE